MPKMVKIGHNPSFNANSDEQKALIESIKKDGVKLVSYQTALENVQLSKGAYRIVPEKTAVAAALAPELEDLHIDDLKMMMLQTGAKTDKVMKKADVIATIRKKLADVKIQE